MFKKVFISYAKEDILQAIALYDFLKSKGYEPWLDKKQLLPGANWDIEIKKALRNADFIILLLSSRSVQKKGYVQREYKLALEHWETRPEEDIYIIPVLLDECQVPFKLEKFQWTKISAEDSYHGIFQALENQKTMYLQQSSVEEIEGNHYSRILSLDNIPDLNIHTDVRIPQFPSNPFFNAETINVMIHNRILEVIGSYFKTVLDPEFMAGMNEEIKSHFMFSSDYQIHYISPKYLSLVLNITYYFGGMHPVHHMLTQNFSFNPSQVLTLDEVVRYDDLRSFLKEMIGNYASQELRTDAAHLIEGMTDYVDFDRTDHIDFVFSNKTLTLVFFNLLPHAFKSAGQIEIPLGDLPLKISVL